MNEHVEEFKRLVQDKATLELVNLDWLKVRHAIVATTDPQQITDSLTKFVLSKGFRMITSWDEVPDIIRGSYGMGEKKQRGPNGLMSPELKVVYVDGSDRLTPATVARTIIHEVAHLLMEKSSPIVSGADMFLMQMFGLQPDIIQRAEARAELATYMVTQHFGWYDRLTPAYLVRYGDDMTPEKLDEEAPRAIEAAQTLIAWLEKEGVTPETALPLAA